MNKKLFIEKLINKKVDLIHSQTLIVFNNLIFYCFIKFFSYLFLGIFLKNNHKLINPVTSSLKCFILKICMKYNFLT